MSKFIFRIILVFFVCLIIASSLIAYYVYALSKELPDIHSLTDYQYDLPTKIYDINNRLVDEYYIKKRILIDIDQIPQVLLNALISVEDSRFYEHDGIDLIRILKAFLVNMINFKIVEGASTITQQTTKLFLLTPERKIERKIKEILLALELEKQFSKKKILELYFNKAYFGRRSYGIEAAAQAYFSKSVKDLEVTEAALLVGLLKAPSRLSPTRNPDLSLNRRNLVLLLMKKNEYLTEEEYQIAIKEPIKLHLQKQEKSPSIVYYIEEVRRLLVKEYGEEEVNRGGYNVYTAMDLNHQKLAQDALEKGLIELDKRHGYRKLNKNILVDGDVSTDAFKKIVAQNQHNKKISQAVVTHVNANYALVKTNYESSKVILLKTVKWARKYDLDSILYKENELKSIKQLFKKGDVIYINNIQNLDSLDQMKKKMTSFSEQDQKTFLQLWKESTIDGEVTLYQAPINNGALFAMSPKTGYVYALSGGFNFDKSQFNRATQSIRQPGSAFKPFIFAAALENDYRASDLLQDTPFVYNNLTNKYSWIPKNYGGNFAGNISFRKSLVKSKNIPTIKIVEDIGVKNIINFLKKFNFDIDKMPHNLSLALGSHAMTLENIVKGYTTFANEGKNIKPIYILKVTDRNGKVIQKANIEKTQGIKASTSFIMNSILGDVVKEGTGKRAKAIQRMSHGKTGTTNNNSDAWYIGYTPNIVTGVYVGNDSPAIPLGYAESGGRVALPIWVDFMKEAVKAYPVESFKKPSNVQAVKVVKSSGLIDCDNNYASYFEFFDQNNIPKDCHQQKFNNSFDSKDNENSEEEIEF